MLNVTQKLRHLLKTVETQATTPYRIAHVLALLPQSYRPTPGCIMVFPSAPKPLRALPYPFAPAPMLNAGNVDMHLTLVV